MGNYSSKLVQGAAIIFIASLFSSVLGYFIRIVLARKLTPEEFGLFFAVYNIILIVGWLKGFGLSSAIGKFIPELNLHQNNVGIKSVLIFVSAFTLLSNILFFLIIYFFPSNIINSYFQSPLGKQLLLALFMYVFIEGLSTILTGYFLSIYRFVLFSLRDVVIRGIVLISIIYLTDLKVLEVAIVYFLASTINLFLNFIYFLKNFKFFSYEVKITKEMSKSLFQFSIPLMIRDFFGVLMARVDNLILVFFRPLVEVGIYNVIMPTADMLLIFSRPFGRILFPLSSELYALKNIAKINSLLQEVHKHLLLLLLPCLVIMVTFSHYILKTFFGVQYAVGYMAMNILTIGFFVTSLNIVSYGVLMGIGKQKEAAIVTIISNILNVLLNLILVPYFGTLNQGYIGAIIATIISSIVLFFLIDYYLRKTINYAFPWKHSSILFFIGLVLLVIGYLITWNISNIYLQIVVYLLGILILYPLSLFLFKITSILEIKTLIAMVFKKDKNWLSAKSIREIFIFEKLRQINSSFWWYLKNPRYYKEFLGQISKGIKQKLLYSHDPKLQQELARQWCDERALNTTEAVVKIMGYPYLKPFEDKFKKVMSEARICEAHCPVKMGGAGNLNILYYAAEKIKAIKVIETGVAYGWSSLALLISVSRRKDSKLISIDKPYPGMGNEKYVGCVVPKELLSHWELLRETDNTGVPKGIAKLGTIDLCHYDSDKSYEGRMKTYPLLWKALHSGGIFISDDIADNMGFHDFCQKVNQEPIIIKQDSHYVGVLLKK